jgi:hypothetical protein
MIRPESDNRDDPRLDYVRSEVEGHDNAVYFHGGSEETVVGSELSEVEDSDEWSMRWYCPACGAVDPPEEELEPAGWTDIHLPCSSEEQRAAAAEQETRVAINIRNAGGTAPGDNR